MNQEKNEELIKEKGMKNSQSDDVLLELLWTKKKLEAFWTMAFGLIICNIPYGVQSLWSVDRVQQGFLRGFLKGSFAGMTFIGVCFFARGIAVYIQAKLKKKW